MTEPMRNDTPHAIEIVPFKRDEYDRGSRKIIVDGVEWGSFRMESHGMHGPSYHAEDLHGSVIVGEHFKGRAREHRFSPFTEKQHRREYMWKDNAPKWTPTDEQLKQEVERLIAAGHLRSPATRDAEIAERRAAYKQAQADVERRDREAFEAKADEVLNAIGYDSAKLEQLDARKLIVEAMRWAQTQ